MRGGTITMRLVVLLLAVVLAGCTRAAGPLPAATVAAPADPAAAEAIQPVAVAFAPVTGVPPDVRFGLESLLKAYAGSRNITVVAEDDPAAQYHLKGRFNAVATTVNATLVYVWEVFDANGRRVTRFAGQEQADGTTGDPWTKVAGQIGPAARETIDALADWLRTQPARKPLP